MSDRISREPTGLTAAVVTVSDRSASGEREDTSGPLASEILTEAGFEVTSVYVVPDESDQIVRLLRDLVSREIALVVTTGGTGFSPRDVTPEASLEVIERRADGIAEEIRRVSRDKTPFSMVSRAVAGIASRSLILNLPGSPKGVRESLDAVTMVLPHALRLLREGRDQMH